MHKKRTNKKPPAKKLRFTVELGEKILPSYKAYKNKLEKERGVKISHNAMIHELLWRNIDPL